LELVGFIVGFRRHFVLIHAHTKNILPYRNFYALNGLILISILDHISTHKI